MGDYLIKSELALLLMYIIYWISIRHQHAFNINRIVIILSVLAASLFPFFQFNFGQYPQIHQTLEPIIVSGAAGSVSGYVANQSTNIFAIVYIVGVIAVAIRSLAGLATLHSMYRRFPKKDYKGFSLVMLEGDQSPFTFFNLLFIGKSYLNRCSLDEIIVHEKAHQISWHTFDLMLMELMTIIHWFNPAVWLFKHDLKSEHEFFADEYVLKNGCDLRRYQRLLLKSNKGISIYLANYFNYSILQKRLKMMTMEKSKISAKIKYAIALPTMILCLAFLLFSFQSNSSVVPDELPEYVQGEEAFYQLLQKNIKYPIEARKANVQGTVYVSFTIDVKGNVKNVRAEDNHYNLLKEIVVVGYSTINTPKKINKNISALENEAERVIGLLGKFKAAEKEGRKVETRMTQPITFKLG